MPHARRALVGLAAALLLAPGVAAHAADPAVVAAGVRAGVYQGGCSYANRYPAGLDLMSVCVWDAVADPETLPVTGGPERTVSVLYSSTTCDPTCATTEGAALVPARDVSFGPGMTAVHVHTDVGGCRVDVDAQGLAQAPSATVGLLDPPVVHGPAHGSGSTYAGAAQYSSNGLTQYFDEVSLSVCGRAALPGDGFVTQGYGDSGVVTSAAVDADAPDGFEGVCLDATVTWYWHATNDRRCVPFA